MISRKGPGDFNSTGRLAEAGRSSGSGRLVPKGGGPLVCCVLRFDSNALRHYRQSLGLRSDRAALVALATAIGASQDWPDQARIVFLARVEPEPVLGILCDGDVDPCALAIQARTCESTLGRLRYVGYRQAEEAVAELADRLRSRLGVQEVRSLSYAAIPRGGLIVLGMLASMLDVPRAQVAAQAVSNSPLVVIDDCAQSGARFGAFLASRPEPQVIFAHLFSHPDLRAAIEKRETRVVACMAARDLRDYLPETFTDGFAEAHRRWVARLGPQRYWVGDCERLCFPWNEPEHVIRNLAAADLEAAWKLVPPPYCFKPGAAAAKPDVQVQPAGRGRLRPSPAVLFGRWNGDTVVARIDSGEVLRLPGSAGAMWWALVKTGDLTAAHRVLIGRYRIDAETLRTDLSAFCADLLARGLLERTTS
ncbi:MAG TPA: PqqD family peptide modification chaperone [Thermoanaerobaculia bacterium]|nr:PqqD family peptide modification chaperone [Thermoanaerobaculia bacterium]